LGHIGMVAHGNLQKIELMTRKLRGGSWREMKSVMAGRVGKEQCGSH
jgi:hypothetical protein